MSAADVMASNVIMYVAESDEVQKRKAALVIAHHAADVEDARNLLGTMGLLEEK